MVHNGIEYGDMQLIGECVWVLKAALGYDAEKIADIMKSWNDPTIKLKSDGSYQEYHTEWMEDGHPEKKI